MVSCLGSLVQPCCGEEGAPQTNVTGLCGEHPQGSGHTGFAPLTGVCSPHLHCSGSRLLYMERALRGVCPPQKRGLGWACILCLPRLSGSGSQELDGGALPGCGAPSPLRGPSLSFRGRPSGSGALCLFSGAGLSPQPSLRMSTMQNLRRSLVRDWKPVCSLVGVTSLGPRLPLSPPRCPWASLLPASSSLELLSPFVLRMAGSVFGPVNFLSLSLAIPQFKLLPHVSSLRLPSGHSAGSKHYPKQCRPLLSVPPPLAGGGCGCLGYFSAGSCF